MRHTKGSERRRHQRLDLDRPVKLQCEMTGKYLAGRTTDVSPDGVQIELAQSSMLVPGQRVRFGIAWTGRQTVLASDDLTPATVVRCLGLGRRQCVALQFDKTQELQLADAA